MAHDFSEDVTPHNMDLRPGKRARKPRAKPEPHPLNLATKAKTEARVMAMPVNPGVVLEPVGENGWRPAAPHSDDDLWDAQISMAFGSNSHSLASLFLRHLKDLCRSAWSEDQQRWKPSETEMNAALAMINDLQPRNSLEAALAAQMVSVHWMQMRLTRDALNNGGMVLERSAALASKLARTYTMQLDQLRALRGEKKPTKQTIKVTRESHHHQHIHVHRGEGSGETNEQAQERRGEQPARIIDQRAIVRSEDKGGVVLPLARAAG